MKQIITVTALRLGLFLCSSPGTDLFHITADDQLAKFQDLFRSLVSEDHQGEATFFFVYAFQENFILVLSRDEVVHGKGSLLNKIPGDPWQKFANLRMFYAWMYAHGQEATFMGCEIGQCQEWKNNQGIHWHLLQYPLHDGLRRLVRHLNFLYKSEPAFSENDDS